MLPRPDPALFSQRLNRIVQVLRLAAQQMRNIPYSKRCKIGRKTHAFYFIHIHRQVMRVSVQLAGNTMLGNALFGEHVFPLKAVKLLADLLGSLRR